MEAIKLEDCITHAELDGRFDIVHETPVCVLNDINMCLKYAKVYKKKYLEEARKYAHYRERLRQKLSEDEDCFNEIGYLKGFYDLFTREEYMDLVGNKYPELDELEKYFDQVGLEVVDTRNIP